MQFGVFLTFRAFLVGFSLAHRHTVNGVQYVAQGFVLAHKGIAAGNEDVTQLRVFFEIGHEAAQFLIPAFFGMQFFKFKVEAFALEIVHTLAGSAKSAAGSPHGIGDKNGHLRIASVDIVTVGQ